MNALISWSRRRQLRQDDGATAVEYSIMLAFIAAIIIVVVRQLGLDLLPGLATVSAGM